MDHREPGGHRASGARGAWRRSGRARVATRGVHSVTASPARVLSRAVEVVAGGLCEPRAPWLTGFGACPGPRAPYLAASLRKGVWPKDGRGWAVMVSRCSSSPSRLPRLWCWRPPGSADARGGNARGQVRQERTGRCERGGGAGEGGLGCHGEGARERFRTVMQRRPEPSRADWTVIGGRAKGVLPRGHGLHERRNSTAIAVSSMFRATEVAPRWSWCWPCVVPTELLALCRETAQALLGYPPPLERALRYRVNASTRLPRESAVSCWSEWLRRLDAGDIRRRAEALVARGPRCWSAPRRVFCARRARLRAGFCLPWPTGRVFCRARRSHVTAACASMKK